MTLDVNCFVGEYPFRPVPGTTIDALERALPRVGIDACWLSHLAAVFWRDPAAGNPPLVEATAGRPAFRPIPAVHPGLPAWERELDGAVAVGAPCIRADAVFYGLDPAGPEMRRLAQAAAERGLPVLMATRLEDIRQRHPHDRFPSLEPHAVRALIRSVRTARLIVTHADRDFVEQVVWGSTPEESERILWDISCIWGPPEDHLAHLLRSLGPERFCFGTGMPLRLPEASVAKLDLTPLSLSERDRIERRNAAGFARPGSA